MDQSWHRRESESSPAFAAFRTYCDDEDRSLQRVSEKVSKSLPLMKRWSRRHAWVERAREFDTYLADKAVEAVVHGRKLLAEKQLRLCRLGTQKAIAMLEGKAKFSAQQAVGLINAIASLTRTIGLETESVGIPQTVVVRIHKNVSLTAIRRGLGDETESESVN